MASEAVGVGTLQRLARLPTGGHPVLSVYLDLDGHSWPGTPPGAGGCLRR
jgi:hypothetical protein